MTMDNDKERYTALVRAELLSDAAINSIHSLAMAVGSLDNPQLSKELNETRLRLMQLRDSFTSELYSEKD